MIVDPDFLSHWRTLMLIDELDGDEMAPLYVIRLWGHCQTRRSDTFDMPSAGLKALCRYRGDSEKFEAAMVSAGFIERNGGEIHVPKWLEHNSSLVKNWRNGGKGGRPKGEEKEPNGNPNETQQEPKANPTGTQGEPNRNPWRTQQEPIREEVREEKKNNISDQPGEVAASSPPAKPAAPSRGTRLPADWCLPKLWGDWALQERPEWDASRVREVAEQFRDHWIAKTGKDATKADWEATWRNWVRRESATSVRSHGARASPSVAAQNQAAFSEARRMLFGDGVQDAAG